MAAIGLGLALGACGPSGAPAATRSADADAGWIRPPEIQTASLRGDALFVAGRAQPNGRVVLRTAAGAAYGSAADAEGRFEILAPLAPDTALLTPETQVGQDAAASADRLLIVDRGRGPIALLRAGGSTRRLDGTAALGAVDTDGRVVLASGFAPRPVRVSAGGGSLVSAPAGDGQWAAMVEVNPVGGEIQVDGASWLWPGVGAEIGSAERPGVERAGEGWRIDWAPRLGARQVAWLPDRR
jgi:hypothetical protein